MTAAVLIKNSGGFINLGHWVKGDSCYYSVGLDVRGGLASIVLIAQVIWAIVEHISTIRLMWNGH